MKFNDQRTNSIFKESFANLPVFDFSGSEDLVFPFEVKTGFINTTEEGIVFNSNVTDYARFERIFTGFEAISAIWQNSTSLLVDDSNINAPIARKNYQPGDAFLWHFDSHTFADNFTTLSENSDYQKEQIVTSATYYSRTKVEASDVLKLYAIPSKYGKILMYIENVEEFYEPSTQQFKFAKISLRSLNDKLADTGLAIDQYVQFSAPGEGYAFPKLIPFINKWDRKAHEFRIYGRKEAVPTITLNALNAANTFIIESFIDENGVNQGECLVDYDKTKATWTIMKSAKGYLLDSSRLQNRPIVSAQLELYAPGLIASIYSYGRPITKKNGQGDVITEPRYLAIDSINIPDLTQRDITKPLSQNSSNIWVPVSRTEIESWWKDWKDQIQGDKNPGIVKQWEGYLRIKTASIPEHKFWNGVFKFALGPIVNGIWNKQLDSAFPTADIPGQPGTTDGYWTIGDGDYSLGYLLNRNYWIHQAVNRVPLNYTESIPWTLKNIPIIGGALSKVTLGIPIAWREQSQTGGQNYNITGMMSKSLFEFQKNTFMGEKSYGNEKYAAVPFDGLKDDAQPAAISPAEFSSIVNFDFTDQYKATPTAPVSNTKFIGFIDDAGRRYEWQNDSVAVPKALTTEGYSIDVFGFHLLGSGTWKITFFALDDNGVKVPVYQGTYRTLSKLTKSVRDWSNTIKLSHWTADKAFDIRNEAPEPSQIFLPKNVNSALNKVDNVDVKPDYELNADGSIKRDIYGNPIQKLTPDGTLVFKTTKIDEVDYVQPGSVQNFTVVPTISDLVSDESNVLYEYRDYKNYNVDDLKQMKTTVLQEAKHENDGHTEYKMVPMHNGFYLNLNEDLFKGKSAIIKQHYDNGFRNGTFTISGSLYSRVTNYGYTLSDGSNDFVVNDTNVNLTMKVTLNPDGTLEWRTAPQANVYIQSSEAPLDNYLAYREFKDNWDYKMYQQFKSTPGKLPYPITTNVLRDNYNNKVNVENWYVNRGNTITPTFFDQTAAMVIIPVTSATTKALVIGSTYSPAEANMGVISSAKRRRTQNIKLKVSSLVVSK